jgi:hypothetical protein
LFERWPVISHRENYRGDDVKSALQSGGDVPSRLRAHASKQFGTAGCADAFSWCDEPREKGDLMKKLALGAI